MFFSLCLSGLERMKNCKMIFIVKKSYLNDVVLSSFNFLEALISIYLNHM